MKKALTIAGSDSGGGAGIQADLKTFSAFGVYGMSVITALTAQNTIGVQAIYEIPPAFVRAQIDSVAVDLGADAVKTGMLSAPEIVEAVADGLARHRLAHIVVDPVMAAKSGDPLLSDAAREVLTKRLIPLAEVVTPNLPEAELLTGAPVRTPDEMREAAARIHSLGCRWVVVKGGHLAGAPGAAVLEALDVVFNGREYTTLSAPYTSGAVVHGTGCTFSAAIAAGLAAGRPPLEAIRDAKRYITKTIERCLYVGQGRPAPNHLVDMQSGRRA